jgi:hypothetical protein
VLASDVGVWGMDKSLGVFDRLNKLLSPNLDSRLLALSAFRGTRFSSAAIISMLGGRFLREGT